MRGLYFEGWRHHNVPRKIRSKQKFFDELSEELLPFTYPGEWGTTVFALLANHCDPGEIADVIDQLLQTSKSFGLNPARRL